MEKIYYYHTEKMQKVGTQQKYLHNDRGYLTFLFLFKIDMPYHSMYSLNVLSWGGRFWKYAIRSSKDFTSQSLFYIKVHREWGNFKYIDEVNCACR